MQMKCFTGYSLRQNRSLILNSWGKYGHTYRSDCNEIFDTGKKFDHKQSGSFGPLCLNQHNPLNKSQPLRVWNNLKEIHSPLIKSLSRHYENAFFCPPPPILALQSKTVQATTPNFNPSLCWWFGNLVVQY